MNRSSGIIIKYFVDKGYGWIKDNNKNQIKDIFFHYKEIDNLTDSKKNIINIEVTYTIGDNKKGKVAKNILLKE